MFVCKQKASYEVGIRDLMSDVCSSDILQAFAEILRNSPALLVASRGVVNENWLERFVSTVYETRAYGRLFQKRLTMHRLFSLERGDPLGQAAPFSSAAFAGARFMRRIRQIPRSEEHTSELQSLMRISYAVFFLKKKLINTHMI